MLRPGPDVCSSLKSFLILPCLASIGSEVESLATAAAAVAKPIDYLGWILVQLYINSFEHPLTLGPPKHVCMEKHRDQAASLPVAKGYFL